MHGLKDLRVPLRLKAMMRSAGFVEVEDRMIQLPTCGWSTGQLYTSTRLSRLLTIVPVDERDYAVGVANQENVQRLLSSVAVYSLTEIYG